MLPCVLARTLPAFFDLSLQLGADVPLAAATTSRPVLRLRAAPRRLLAPGLRVTPRLLLTVAAGRSLLAIAAAMTLLLLRPPGLLLTVLPAWLRLSFLASGPWLEAFDDALLDVAIDQPLDGRH